MTSRRDWRDDRVLQAGFLVGTAVGAAATVLGRRFERSARRGLVDWPTVERVAIARLRRAPGSLSDAELRATEPAYAEAMARIIPALSEALGTDLPGVVERSGVVDRAEWVRANVVSFTSMLGRLERHLLDQIVPPEAGFGKAAMAIANRWVATRQLGFLLGFMGQRVLGQYDLALLSAETTPGRLLFVEENIRRTAHSLGVPLDAFRTWIALHETTHAFEFEAHPWLRPYLAERLEAQLDALGRGKPTLGKDALDVIGRWLRGENGGGSWIERLMSDEQARSFRETQAVIEPAGRLLGLHHGCCRAGPGTRRRADQRPLPRPARAAHRHGQGHPAADRHGPQAGPVPARRTVRRGRRDRPRSRGPAATMGGPRDATSPGRDRGA